MNFRRAKEGELDQIYLMGENVWSEGTTREEYLESCRNSSKYKKGIWWVLELNKKLVCSLITHDLNKNWIGIGSLATPEKERGKGYAIFFRLKILL